ncbi:MAG: hypothetical protein WC516_07730 [Patescibacteria group bacterium]
MEETKNPFKDQQFLLGLFGGIAVIAVIGLIVLAIAFVSVAQKTGQVKGQATTTAPTVQNQGQTGDGPEAVPATAPGISTFSEKKDATICKEDGKPVVYLFSTTWCSHCEWIKDTFDKTVAAAVAAGKIKAYHWELDTNDNTLTSQVEDQIPENQMAVYNEFNPGGSIPTFVFGCKYFRVGNGYESTEDLAKEVAEFNAVIADIAK